MNFHKHFPEITNYKGSQGYLNKTVIAVNAGGKRRPESLYEQILLWTNVGYDAAHLKLPDLESKKTCYLKLEEYNFLNTYALELFQALRKNEHKTMTY